MKNKSNQIASFIKVKRKSVKIKQLELAIKAGVGLRFVRDLEQSKKTLRIDKINQVLYLFGHRLGPVPIDREELHL
jgi:y4mF family transcriptional regulator